LQLDCRSFSCYDPSTQTWIIPEGNYRISVGSSSRDIRLSQQVVVHGKKNPAVQVSGSTWYYTLQGKPTQSDLESLLGHTIEPMHSPQKGEYTIFSSLQDMQTNPIIRIMKKVVEGTVAKGYGGADYFNPNFKGIIETTANNPLRSLVTSSNGALRLNVAQGLVDLANGHLIKGLKSFFSGVPKPDQTKIYYQE
jgi:beta-glucosidase